MASTRAAVAPALFFFFLINQVIKYYNFENKNPSSPENPPTKNKQTKNPKHCYLQMLEKQSPSNGDIKYLWL